MHGSRDASIPRFVFSLAKLRENAEAFRTICDRTLSSCGYEAYFPIKVAPFPAIVGCLRELGFGLEAISHRTGAMAQQSAGTRTILTGAVKPTSLIACGLQTSPWTYVSCESLTDLARVNAVATRYGSRLAVLLRLKATPKRRLGMSLEDARWSVTHAEDFPALRFAGLHLHSGSNLTSREADLTLERMRTAANDLARYGLGSAVLNFGGGLPCVNGHDTEIQRRLEGFAQLADALGARIIVEPGRALVGDAAELVAEITDVRPADRELTINSAAYVIHGPCNADRFVVHRRCDDNVERRYEVVRRKEGNYRIGGIWPAEGDSLWLDVPTPEFAIGDRIVFPQAGAYTLGFLAELSLDELVPIIAK